MKLYPHLIFLLALSVIETSQVKAQNIMISNQRKPNEPSIMMNPKNPANLIAAANINNYYISSDTGRTWVSKTLSSPYGVWGDPVISVDTSGHFYFFHLSNPPSGSWIDRIVCQKTTDNGTNWNDGSYTGKNGDKAQDKQWCAVDRKKNILYLTWTQFDKYDSSDPKDKSTILFSKSIDQGATWTDPIKINKVDGDCLDSDNTVEGAVPTVGPNGEVYVSWAGPEGIVFNKSTDEGMTWLDEEIKVNAMPGGWDMDIPGISRANGLPVTVCDLSDGLNHGTIYVNWADQRNGTDDTDIWLAKSTNGGLNWSSPIRVNNDPPGQHQFFTWMTIDQVTGYLYFLFYDRRNHDTFATDVYMAISKDLGATFTNHKISESPFTPNANIFFGDYTNIVAHNNIVRPIWTRLDNGNLSVWTDVTQIEKLVITTDHPVVLNAEMNAYPNPSDDLTYVSFKLKKSMNVNLEIISLADQSINKIITNEIRSYGSYVETINLKSLQLPSGIYMIKLSLDGEIKTKRQVVIR